MKSSKGPRFTPATVKYSKLRNRRKTGGFGGNAVLTLALFESNQDNFGALGNVMASVNWRY